MARRMKVGVMLPQWTGQVDGRTPGWQDTLAVARRAEEVGFDSIWLCDDLLVRWGEGQRLGFWECWSFLAALAASTSRVELGTLVTCVGFRNPAMLAKMADAVEEISRDRLILGLGAGGDPGEHRAFGAPWERRFERFEEALEIVRRLGREGAATFEGRHHRVDGCQLEPRGSRRGGPPVMVGTVSPGPRVLGLTARYAELWNVFLGFTPDGAEALPALNAAVDAACREAGRDPDTLGRTACVGVALDGHRLTFGWDITEAAIKGSDDAVAEELAGFADQRIEHLQVVLAPCDVAGVERMAGVLARLDRG